MSETKMEVVERYGGFSDKDVDHVALRVAELMKSLGLPLVGDHFAETPRRVAAMLLYFTQDIPLDALLKDGFENAGSSSMVVQKHIPFKGLCAHHLLPFFGTAAVGYVPSGKVVGLSKLTRLVAAAGLRAPSTQEAITDSIAGALAHSNLVPASVLVVSKAVHGCMAVRGVNSPRTETIAMSTRLIAPGDHETFFQLIGEDW